MTLFDEDKKLPDAMGQNAMAAGGTLANMPAPRAPHAARGLPRPTVYGSPLAA